MYFGSKRPYINHICEYARPKLDLFSSTLIPSTSISLFFLIDAIFLSRAYLKANPPHRVSWIQGLLSICTVAASGSIVSSVLLGGRAEIFYNDLVLPVHACVFLTLYFVPGLQPLLEQVPDQICNYANILPNATFRSGAFLSSGCDPAIRQIGLKESWLAQVVSGGFVGSSGVMLILLCNLFGETWSFSSKKLDSLPFDAWGPYLISLIYVLMKDSSPILDTLANGNYFGDAKLWKTLVVSEEEAKTIGVLTFASLQFLQVSGLFDLTIPGKVFRVSKSGRSLQKKNN